VTEKKPTPQTNRLSTSHELVKADPVLPSIEKAIEALSVAYQNRDAKAAKEIRDQAEAIKVYIARRDGSRELANQASEIQIRAEWTIGKILADMAETGERAGRGGSPMSRASTLPNLGISRDLSSKAQHIATIPRNRLDEWIDERKTRGDAITSGGVQNLSAEIRKELSRDERDAKTAEAIAELEDDALANFESVCDLRCCSFEDLLPTIKPDAIVTDPPYPHEFLPLYGRMAELAIAVPTVAVMCGQSYIPKIFEMMTAHLRYRWTIAYMTPGAATQIWVPKVNTSWKPVLLFGDSERWIQDVTMSSERDKDHHRWGQSVSGMISIVSEVTKPGDLVCDPFLGAGTTAIACYLTGRRFVGCDIDKQCVATSRSRMLELVHERR